MKRKLLVIGNWKMNPLTASEAEKLYGEVAKGISRVKNAEVVICPPVLYLEKLKRLSKKISLGAQDAFYGGTGAFTGEVSSEMLSRAGARYVIMGHSERRVLGETNGEVNKKVKAALASSLCPILCVGETVRDENHEYFSLVKTQLEESLKGISKNAISKIIIAYEPVWALSTTPNRRDATPDDSREMAIFIRKILSDKWGGDASKVKIIYGGSVNEKDAEDFLRNGGVDGLLPGRASLHAKKFLKIINITDNL